MAGAVAVGARDGPRDDGLVEVLSLPGTWLACSVCMYMPAPPDGEVLSLPSTWLACSVCMCMPAAHSTRRVRMLRWAGNLVCIHASKGGTVQVCTRQAPYQGAVPPYGGVRGCRGV